MTLEELTEFVRRVAAAEKAFQDNNHKDPEYLLLNLAPDMALFIADQATKIQELEEEIRELRGALEESVSVVGRVLNGGISAVDLREYRMMAEQALKDNT